MTKDFFKFRGHLNEEEQKDDSFTKRAKERKSLAKKSEFEKKVDKKLQELVQAALHDSQSPKSPDFFIYQDVLVNPAYFKSVKVPNNGTIDDAVSALQRGTENDRDRFTRLICIVRNGEVEEISKPLYDLGESILEKFSGMGRRSLKRSARKNKIKLRLARLKAKKRRATRDRLSKRATKRARKIIKNKLLKGRNIKKLSTAQLNRLNLMVDARPGQLDALRRKLLPQVRKDEFGKHKKKK